MMRQEVILKLEAQVKQLVYGKNALRNKKTTAPDGSQRPVDDSDEYDGLLDARLHNLKPDENILEIWVKSAQLVDGVITPGSSTFAVIDFFDYESQATPVVSGLKPKWDFAATYRVTIDDFLIRFLATEFCTIELNMVGRID